MPRKPKPRPRGGVPGKHASPRTGSVYQLATGPRRGVWRGVATATLLDGTRRRIYVVGPDEASARAALDRRWAEVEGRTAPTAAADAGMTIDSLLARWLTESVRVDRRGSTYETYLIKATHITKHLGRLAARDLTRSQVRWFVGQLAADGLAVSTIRTTMEVLSIALNYAVRELEILPRNPSTGVGLPQAPVTHRPTLSPDQIRRVLSATQETAHPLGPLVALVVTTGIRRGEAIGLRWQDVNLDVGALRIVQQRARGNRDERVIVSAPKTSAGQRPIPLMPAVVAQLRAYREAQLAARLRSVQPWANSDLVFRQPDDGRPFAPEYVDRVWARLLVQMGLPHMRLHDLRHTFGTLMMGAGVNSRIVAELMGHSSVGITLNVYSHVLQSMETEAIDRLEGQLFPVSGNVDDDVAVQPPGEATEAG